MKWFLDDHERELRSLAHHFCRSRQPVHGADRSQVESLVALEVLMRIEELLVDPRRREHAAMPEAAFVPSTRLELEADSAEFFVGNVPGGDEAPPNHMEADDATIRAGLPSWTSTFEPVHAVLLDPASSDPN
jgi:hypothetical protein